MSALHGFASALAYLGARPWMTTGIILAYVLTIWSVIRVADNRRQLGCIRVTDQVDRNLDAMLAAEVNALLADIFHDTDAS